MCLSLQLDDEERRQMAEGQGVDSDEYRRFVAQPSGTMDDTGFFSVQVNTSFEYLNTVGIQNPTLQKPIFLKISNPDPLKTGLLNIN